jgi:Ca-activated chloride channel family protein
MIFLHFFSLKTIRGKALKFANFEAIARVKGVDLYSKNISLLLLDIFFVVILVFSLSGLIFHLEVSASTFSFILAIDSSESMEAVDLEPDRISVAKEVAKDFVDNSPFDSRIGVVSFSGNSYIEQDLTDNKQMLKSSIEKIEVSTISGTDIYEAIAISSNLLKEEKSKAIILLSDGQINTGDIGRAITYAKENDVIIHTVAIGTVEGGEVSYGISRLDEDTLKGLAYNTNGKYFNAQTKEELESSFNEIRQITRRLGKINLSNYLLILAILIFLSRQFLVSLNKIMW